jgi:CheY-like chemotaxis protein
VSDTRSERSYPRILIVDDQPHDQQSLVDILDRKGMDAAAVHPAELTNSLVLSADMFLVDEYLEYWEERKTGATPAQMPQDGLAVAAVIRSIRREHGRRAVIAIRTGLLPVLGMHLPAGQRDSLLAAQHDLEWVFSKADVPGEPPNVERIISLAQAAYSLPELWRPGTGLEWLGLTGSEEWHSGARRSVDDARPPAHAVASHTSGKSYLRWFLQRILPFPTFLLSDLYAATRLGISVETLGEILSSGSPLSERLSPGIYSGPLSGFTTRRWWKSQIDQLLEQLSVAGLSPFDIAEGLSSIHGSPVPPLALENPVVAVDADYRYLPDPIDAEDAFRLALDGWPVFADDPWAEGESIIDDPQLRGLVAQVDQYRIKTAPQS